MTSPQGSVERHGAAWLRGARVVDDFGTGLRRTRVLSTDHGYLWCRSAGPLADDRDDPAEPARSPGETCALFPRPVTIDGEDVYLAPGRVSLASMWLRHGPRSAGVLCGALRTVAGAVDRNHVPAVPGTPAPAGIARLSRWLSSGTGVGTSARLHRQARSVWGARRIEAVTGWIHDLVEPGNAVVLHGGISLGSIVVGPSAAPIVMTGRGLRAGAAELELGWMLGELLEFEGQVADPAAPSPLRAIRRTVVAAGPDSADLRLLAAAAVLRIAAHTVEYAAFVGWSDELTTYLRTVGVLIDELDADHAHFVQSTLLGSQEER